MSGGGAAAAGGWAATADAAADRRARRPALAKALFFEIIQNVLTLSYRKASLFFMFEFITK